MITSKIVVPAISPEPPAHYPCLREGNDGLVVLFHAPQEGMIVRGGTGVYKDGEGHYSGSWGMHHFKSFSGAVQLSNR